MKIGREMAEIR